jgi:hypothetical protein
LTIPVWLKPALWGAFLGAIAMSIVGFSQLGWTTAGTAERQAQERADTAVVAALVPFCLEKAQHDPDVKKLATLRAENSSYSRNQLVSDAGWATLAGANADRNLARECAEKLYGIKAN